MGETLYTVCAVLPLTFKSVVFPLNQLLHLLVQQHTASYTSYVLVQRIRPGSQNLQNSSFSRIKSSNGLIL